MEELLQHGRGSNGSGFFGRGLDGSIAVEFEPRSCAVFCGFGANGQLGQGAQRAQGFTAKAKRGNHGKILKSAQLGCVMFQS